MYAQPEFPSFDRARDARLNVVVVNVSCPDTHVLQAVHPGMQYHI